MADKYLTFKEAQETLGVSIDELKNLISTGELKAIRTKGEMKIRQEEIDRFRSAKDAPRAAGPSDSSAELSAELSFESFDRDDDSSNLPTIDISDTIGGGGSKSGDSSEMPTLIVDGGDEEKTEFQLNLIEDDDSSEANGLPTLEDSVAVDTSEESSSIGVGTGELVLETTEAAGASFPEPIPSVPKSAQSGTDAEISLDDLGTISLDDENTEQIIQTDESSALNTGATIDLSDASDFGTGSGDNLRATEQISAGLTEAIEVVDESQPIPETEDEQDDDELDDRPISVSPSAVMPEVVYQRAHWFWTVLVCLTFAVLLFGGTIVYEQISGVNTQFTAWFVDTVRPIREGAHATPEGVKSSRLRQELRDEMGLPSPEELEKLGREGGSGSSAPVAPVATPETPEEGAN